MLKKVISIVLCVLLLVVYMPLKATADEFSLSVKKIAELEHLGKPKNLHAYDESYNQLGLAWFRREDLNPTGVCTVGAVNQSGELVVPFGKYYHVDRINNEYAHVVKPNLAATDEHDTCTHFDIIDKEGNIVYSSDDTSDTGIPKNIRYEDKYRRFENYIKVEQDDKFGMNTKQGDVIVPCEYEEVNYVSYSSEKGSVVFDAKREDWIHVIYNERGEQILEYNPYTENDNKRVRELGEYLYVHNNSSEFPYGKLVDKLTGEIVFEGEYSTEYNGVYFFLDDYIVATSNQGKSDIYNKLGEVVVSDTDFDGYGQLFSVDAKKGIFVVLDGEHYSIVEISFAVGAAGFRDVKDKDWYAKSVEHVVSNGLFNGVSANCFAPNDNITRAMVITVLARHADAVNTNSGGYPGRAWWEQAVEWGINEGITDGSDMESNITREQMAAILLRYILYSGMDYTVDDDYRLFPDDQEISDWAKEPVQVLNKLGIINGRPDKSINPHGNATRAEVAAMLYRLMSLADE
ncbi:MAG: S-layer homology domain-containing protein [Peptococcaceae bacterium]|nr:S-layer homology domain-containing protein [Peptococcaceae bacterium]